MFNRFSPIASWLVAVTLAFFASYMCATSAHASAPTQTPTYSTKLSAQDKANYLQDITSSGDISPEQQSAITKKYSLPPAAAPAPATLSTPVAPTHSVSSKAQEPAPTTSTALLQDGNAWLNSANALRVVAALFFFFAFSSFIKKLILVSWAFIAAVPVLFYQTFFLGLCTFAALMPEVIWKSQAFYIALFAANANIVILSWIFGYNPRLRAFLAKIFRLGVNPFIIAFGALAAYYGAFAIVWNSQIFGFLAIACTMASVSVTAFVVGEKLHYRVLANLELMLATSSVIVLGVYLSLFHMQEYSGITNLFRPGVEYLATLTLVMCCLFNSIAWRSFNFKSTLWSFFFSALALGSLVLYSFFPEHRVIFSIICSMWVIWMFHWLVWWSMRIHFMVGSTVVGIGLYAAALFMEHYGNLLVLKSTAFG